MDLNLIPFGLHVESDTLVDVSEVPKGNKCGCTCPACKTPLVARQGDENVWHFAHASRKVYKRTEKECEFSFFVSVRMMARQVVGNELKINIPEYIDSVSEYDELTGRSVSESFIITDKKQIVLSDVKVETSFSNIPVDIVGSVNNFHFVIYFTHPGRTIPKELFAPLDKYCGVIQIELDRLRERFELGKSKTETYRSILIEYLTNEMDSKHWAFHPRYQKCKNQAQSRLESKLSRLSESGNISTNRDADIFISPQKRRVLFECLMCKVEWEGWDPGGSFCPKCSTLLYRVVSKTIQT